MKVVQIMPLGSNGAPPQGFKIFLLTCIGKTALIFIVWHHLMVLFDNCSNYDPGVKWGPAPGVQNFSLDLCMENLKIFFSKTIRPKVLIFSMLHHLMVLYENCSNYAPGVKCGPICGFHTFNIDLFRDNLKNSSSKP